MSDPTPPKLFNRRWRCPVCLHRMAEDELCWRCPAECSDALEHRLEFDHPNAVHRRDQESWPCDRGGCSNICVDIHPRRCEHAFDHKLLRPDARQIHVSIFGASGLSIAKRTTFALLHALRHESRGLIIRPQSVDAYRLWYDPLLATELYPLKPDEPLAVEIFEPTRLDELPENFSHSLHFHLFPRTESAGLLSDFKIHGCRHQPLHQPSQWIEESDLLVFPIDSKLLFAAEDVREQVILQPISEVCARVPEGAPQHLLLLIADQDTFFRTFALRCKYSAEELQSHITEDVLEGYVRHSGRLDPLFRELMNNGHQVSVGMFGSRLDRPDMVRHLHAWRSFLEGRFHE